MAGNSQSGFASYSPAQRKYVSAKGGRVKTRKGFALLPVEKRREVQRRGGLKRQDNLRKLKEQNEQDSIPSRNDSLAEEVPRDGTS